ncbi:MAG: M23 family metallopeptidase [Theionarchaea archaeon]|nr:M23 family metallopeptidase [Theionarchaea archaeon]
MNITVFPQEYVINATRKVGSGVESDFFVRVVHIKNTTSDTVTLKKFQFDVKIGNTTVKQVTYPEEVMDSLTKKSANTFSQLTGEIAHIVFGRKKFWDNQDISDSPVLNLNQETGIFFEHFRILDETPVDACVISVGYLQNGKEKVQTLKIPIIQYKNKNKYIFPLNGAWLVSDNYDSIYTHRRPQFEEFAMDLVQLTDDFSFVPHPDSANEDYACYGKEVYAIADGEVVDCLDELPENPGGFNSRLPEEQWDALINQYGWVAGMAGNYVVLKHAGDEYSFYAHLIPHSLTVKEGDFVNLGQVIGLLGNSGNSDAPHLHFHLMDGPDILSARGLPCTFTNLKDIMGEPVTFIQDNRSIVHAD